MKPVWSAEIPEGRATWRSWARSFTSVSKREMGPYELERRGFLSCLPAHPDVILMSFTVTLSPPVLQSVAPASSCRLVLHLLMHWGRRAGTRDQQPALHEYAHMLYDMHFPSCSSVWSPDLSCSLCSHGKFRFFISLPVRVYRLRQRLRLLPPPGGAARGIHPPRPAPVILLSFIILLFLQQTAAQRRLPIPCESRDAGKSIWSISCVRWSERVVTWSCVPPQTAAPVVGPATMVWPSSCEWRGALLFRCLSAPSVIAVQSRKWDFLTWNQKPKV